MFFRNIMGVKQEIEMEQGKKFTIGKAISVLWLRTGYIGKT